MYDDVSYMCVSEKHPCRFLNILREMKMIEEIRIYNCGMREKSNTHLEHELESKRKGIWNERNALFNN